MDSLKGAIAATASSFLAALVFAYIFRIPVPMFGLLGPLGQFSAYSMNFLDVLTAVIVAWLFYGAFGGFVIVPALGAIAGWFAGKRFPSARDRNRNVVLWAAVAGVIPVFGLSVLDLVIGPW